MKTAFLIVLLALSLAVCASAVTTATATVQLYAMTNQICAPLVPIDPAPLYEGGLGIMGVFAGWTDLYMGSDTVKKFEPTNGSEKTLLGEWGADEGVLAGDGYIGWVDGYTEPVIDPVKSFSFDGVDISDTDLWISLPGITGGSGGTHWIGITYPVGTVINYLAVIVTDGTDSYTMEQIATGGEGIPTDWIDAAFIYYDATSQGEKPVPWEWAMELYGGQMYRVTTMKSNLALIIPHP